MPPKFHPVKRRDIHEMAELARIVDLHYRTVPGGRWKNGRFREIEVGGGVVCVDAKTSNTRTLDPAVVEIEMLGKGPRGGTKWFPWDEWRETHV